MCVCEGVYPSKRQLYVKNFAINIPCLWNYSTGQMDNKISLAVSRGGLRLLRNLGFGLKTFQSKIESNGSSFREKNARPVDNCALLIIPKKNEEKETYSTSVVPVTKWILVVVLTNNYKLLKNAIFSLVLLEFQLTRIRSLVPFPYGID